MTTVRTAKSNVLPLHINEKLNLSAHNVISEKKKDVPKHYYKIAIIHPVLNT